MKLGHHLEPCLSHTEEGDVLVMQKKGVHTHSITSFSPKSSTVLSIRFYHVCANLCIALGTSSNYKVL